jgi:hypothetical protein
MVNALMHYYVLCDLLIWHDTHTDTGTGTMQI